MVETVSVEPRSKLGIASIMARKGVSAETIGAALETVLHDRPVVSGEGGVRFVGTGPGTWLAVHDAGAPDFAEGLARRLDGLASVSDQSSGYTVLRVCGEGARKLLQRGAAIDFHPTSFAPSAVATTVIAHIGVVIWQVDDRPTYDIATFRSVAGSFRQWVDHAAAALAF